MTLTTLQNEARIIIMFNRYTALIKIYIHRQLMGQSIRSTPRPSLDIKKFIVVVAVVSREAVFYR